MTNGRFRHRQLAWLLSLWLPGAVSAAEPEPDAVTLLLQQVQAAEAVDRDDLVAQALYRLQGIAPDNPRVLAAQVRQALHQGDRVRAQQALTQLQLVAAGSPAAAQAAIALHLTTLEGRQQLQQARLLATSGRIPQAVAQYDSLFHGTFPDSNLALEYWRTVARLPQQAERAEAELETLERASPANVNLHLTLAQMALAKDQREAAYQQLTAAAQSEAGRETAAGIWLGTLTSQPVSASTVAALQRYLQVFDQGQPQIDGRAELQLQQKKLADPAYQAQLRGLALLEKGEGRRAIPALEEALRATPDDPALLGAMGQALARDNQRAKAAPYFARAIARDAHGADINKWLSLQKSNLYWLAIGEGDTALAGKNLAEAEKQYLTARALDGRDAWALIGLGDVRQAQHNSAGAEQAYLAARRLDAANPTVVRRLAALYQQQSPERALQFIAGLPSGQQRQLAETVRQLKGSAYSAAAERLAAQGSWPDAAAQYRLALNSQPQDVWLHYHYAEALRHSGQLALADEVMAALARRRPEPAQVYAGALWLASRDRDPAALQMLQTLPQAQWTPEILALHQRLTTEQRLRQAEQLQAEGHEKQALALLQTLPASPRTALMAADWALARGDATEALTGYQTVLRQVPDSEDARLGEIEALLVLNRTGEARHKLQQWPASRQAMTLNTGRRLANAWLMAGDRPQAQRGFRQLQAQAAAQAPSQQSALFYRDAARLQDRPGDALQDYRQAMAAAGMATPPADDIAFTRQLRTDDRDDWLQRSIRRDAADLYRQQAATLTLAEDYSRSRGTGGISDFTAHTTMLQAETPLDDGRLFARLDNVALSAGRFSSQADGRYHENFGSCASSGCDRDWDQRQNGTSIGVGFHNQHAALDIGTTPLGFTQQNLVGGATWTTSLSDLGLSLTASRRAISSSLLAYAGARDPNSGQRWGGVVATGGALGLSYDRGGPDGVWADLSAHQLSGENVADNSRERLMAGYYRKLINQSDRRMTVGLNSMFWHYARDLSDYSLGQGGYYSPQRYFSLALPVTWRQRSDNWSVDLGGSLSWSQSETRSEARYPLSAGGPDNPQSGDSSSSGLGYTLQATVERRLTAHWTLGVGMDIQQAKDYTPSHGLLYVRYSLAGWQGDLDLPPQPLTPYADMK